MKETIMSKVKKLKLREVSEGVSKREGQSYQVFDKSYDEDLDRTVKFYLLKKGAIIIKDTKLIGFLKFLNLIEEVEINE